MKTIFEITPNENDLDISSFKYQVELTKKLDNLNSDFNQEILNEIILWKVNRYAEFDQETISLLNKINPKGENIQMALTGDVLLKLLDKKGVRLAIASTILRFRNPKVYQIIDQRVYRFIYGEELKYSESNKSLQINIYLDYLNKLKEVCAKFSIKFEEADRILYNMDKEYNRDLKLKGY